MKNKKLIATVASLCLVLVAVVAAVVGVLAAAQQNATSKVKVHYTATNVKATVSVNSKDEYGSWNGTEQDSTSFNAGDESRPGTAAEDTLEVSQITLNWRGATEQSNPGKLNRYAVYRFKFINQSSNNAMSVSLTYTAPASDYDSNVELFWFAGTDENPTFAAAYESDNTTLDEVTATPSSGSKSCDDVTLSGKTLMVSSVSKDNGTAYVYLVVAISNLELNADYDLITANNGGQILFTLEAIAA